MARNWGKETQKVLQKDPSIAVGLAFAVAYDTVASKMGWDAERRAATDEEFQVVQARLAEFPLARTKPFFDGPEAKAKGTGGLLSVTVNPDACKGCNLCVEVCPERRPGHGQAGRAATAAPAPQLGAVESPARHRRPIRESVTDIDEGIGVLSSLLLKKATYRSMVGGDGACMGCGEKTAAHLIRLGHPRPDGAARGQARGAAR